MTFRLSPLSDGANPLYWNTLQDLIGEADIPITPDASYRPYQEAVKTLAGTKYGRGFASAVWSFSGLTPQQKYILRQLCTDLSSDVYIETPTNDFDVSGNREWIPAQGVMEWVEGEQDIQGGSDGIITIDFEITFSHLVEVV